MSSINWWRGFFLYFLILFFNPGFHNWLHRRHLTFQWSYNSRRLLIQSRWRWWLFSFSSHSIWWSSCCARVMMNSSASSLSPHSARNIMMNWKIFFLLLVSLQVSKNLTFFPFCCFIFSLSLGLNLSTWSIIYSSDFNNVFFFLCLIYFSILIVCLRLKDHLSCTHGEPGSCSTLGKAEEVEQRWDEKCEIHVGDQLEDCNNETQTNEGNLFYA